MNKNSTYEQQSAEHFKRVGQRLKELRLMSDMSQVKLEQKLGLKTNAVINFENGKGATMFTLLALVNYFDSLGYNMNWIFKYDNYNTFKKETQFVSADHNINEIKDKVSEIKNSMEKHLKEFTQIMKKVE